MNTTLITRPAHAAAQTRTAAAERFNIYLAIHKALRGFMSDTLCRVGCMDLDDSAETGATLAQLDTLLALCAEHIEHEDDFLHAAIEARQPEGSARTRADHLEHAEAIEALRGEAAGLASACPEDRAMRALRLYRHLALFVADNFQHMHIEETANAAVLWAHYSDAELHAIHERLLATIAPQSHLLVARWMLPAMTPAERAGLLNQMKQQTPPEAFLGVLAHVRPHLDHAAWNKLARAVDVPQVPGLVDMR